MIKKIHNLFLLIFSVAAVTLIVPSCKTTKSTTSPPVKPTPAPVIPKDEPDKSDLKDDKKDELVKFNIALVMPFELKANFNVAEEELIEPEIKQSSLPALSFYEGALMAADSLISQKKEVKISAYETPSDSSGFVKLFSNQLIKDAGVVLATIPNNLVPVAASIAEKKGVNLVCTQASSPEFLEGKNHVALAYSSTVTQCKEVVAALLKKNPVSNIILVYRKVKREDELAEFFRAEILQRKGNNEFREINTSENASGEIIKVLSKTKRNLIFVVSSDEAFISPLLTAIEQEAIYGIQISGLPTWQNFESIDFMSFENIQVNIFENNFINYEDPDRILFRKNFISRYFSDPQPSAFNGFDLVFELGKNASNTNSNLKKMIQKSFSDNPNFKFDESSSAIMENKCISVLRFNDYKLEIVPLK